MVRPIQVTDEMILTRNSHWQMDVRAKRQAWMDVRAWGAKGDGVTDDTAAIQRAIGDQARGIVYLPRGDYLCGPLRLPRWTKLVGDGYEHTRLLCRPGTVGNWISDETIDAGGVGIMIENLALDAQHETVTALYLGYGTYPWGTFALMKDCIIENVDGYALQAKGNVAYLEHCEFLDARLGVLLEGSTWMATNLTFAAGPTHPVVEYGLRCKSYASVFSNMHFEGPYASGCIEIDAASPWGRLNTFHNVSAAVAPGVTLDHVARIAQHCYGNYFTNLSVILGGGGAALTDGILDESYLGDLRKVAPQVTDYVHDYLYIRQYMTGREPIIVPRAIAGPPDVGQWHYGDRADVWETGYGHAVGYKCVVSGAPGLWGAVGTLPGAVAKNSDYNVTPEDTGKRFSNVGAGGVVTFTLPADARNLEYEFICVAAHALRVDPNDGTDSFYGQGGGKYLELSPGQLVRIGSVANNLWFVTRQVGTPTYEP